MLHHEVKLAVSQEADCRAADEIGNWITVKTANGGIDAEDWFFVLECQRWAVEQGGVRGFLDMLAEMFNRVGIATDDLAKRGLDPEAKDDL